MQLLQVPTQLDQPKQFRQELYQLFPYRADALMDLLDALCSNTQARSVVELSLNPLFRREYGSLHDALDQLFHASSPEEAGMARRRTFGELSRAAEFAGRAQVGGALAGAAGAHRPEGRGGGGWATARLSSPNACKSC